MYYFMLAMLNVLFYGRHAEFLLLCGRHVEFPTLRAPCWIHYGSINHATHSFNVKQDFITFTPLRYGCYLKLHPYRLIIN